MKKPGALQELTQHTTEELNRLSPEEREQLRSNVLKQFGLPPLAAVRGLAGEAVIFTGDWRPIGGHGSSIPGGLGLWLCWWTWHLDCVSAVSVCAHLTRGSREKRE
jgi:hypothetical protein